jgi:hypothetical protein
LIIVFTRHRENYQMPSFESASLWRKTLGTQGETDKSADVREGLRSAYLKFRERAALLAAEISRDLPDYTVHDVTHLDSLWHLADLIVGPNVTLTPLEAFVLGGAFLVHDLGNGLAAYPDGITSLKSSPIWDDTIALALRAKFGRAPTASELRSPDASVEKAALEAVLRRLHAEYAERLALVSWSDSDSREQYHLIEDPFLRQHFGKLIGRIAHSHWWPARRLPSEFESVIGPPAGYPREWTLDPLTLACILRVADAAHLDSARAPLWLKIIRRPQDSSKPHWIFQEKLHQPIAKGDRLQFTSVPFGVDEVDAWWLCFDALELLDRELFDVDAILASSQRGQFAMKGVHGAGQADRLCRLIETEGWLPVDTKVKVSDVAGLAQKLGGKQLYGNNLLVPLRELVQNASDAIRARSFLQSWPADQGEITVQIGQDEHGHFIDVADNGVGMSKTVITGCLLDFGKSFWLESQVSQELPGLLSSGFEPTGRYGIGFFSVFMWSQHIRVTSRRYTDAQVDTHILEFTGGLGSRPLFRKAGANEYLEDGGTAVRVWLTADPEGSKGILHSSVIYSGKTDEKILELVCQQLCPALDTNLFVRRCNGDRTAVVLASDWKTMSDRDLIHRIVHPRFFEAEVSHGDHEDDLRPDVHQKTTTELVNDIISMVRPVFDGEGNLVGRLALVPSIWRLNWTDLGVVTAGGFRAGGIAGASGILLGTPVRAARDIAIPVVPLKQLQAWVQEQERLVVERVQDPETLLECAATVRVCRLIPQLLPIAQGSDRSLKTASEIKAWAQMNDEIILIQREAFELLQRKLGKVRALPNVLLVNVGARALVFSELRDSPERWPNDRSEFYQFTLEGAVVQLIAEAWGVRIEELTELLLHEPRSVVAVGKSHRKTVRTGAVILRRRKTA